MESANKQSFNNVFIKFCLTLLVALHISLSYSHEIFDFEFYVGPSISVISICSLLFYITVLLFSVIKEKYYFFLLPLIIAFVPNAVNDLLPSVLMGVSKNYATPSFSFFTHIDIFLFVGILRYCNFSKKRTKNEDILFILVLMVALVYILTLFENGDFWIKLMGGYQLRYYVFVFFLISYSEAIFYVKDFLSGLVFAIFFVGLESVTFSLLRDVGGRLTSGNFGVNPLGHLLAAGCAMTIFMMKDFKIKTLSFLIIICLFLGCILTGTRFSLIALFSGVFFVSLAKTKNIKSFLIYAISVVLISLSFVFIVPQGRSIVDGALFAISQDFSDDKSITRTPESSSMITRLLVWSATAEMVADNSILGVGPGVWSFRKEDYDIPFDGLLDPHNDLFAYIVAYGVLAGAIFYGIVFIYPVIQFLKIRTCSLANHTFAGVAFLFSIFCSSFTNSVTYKHQLGVLTYLVSLFILSDLKMINVQTLLIKGLPRDIRQ